MRKFAPLILSALMLLGPQLSALAEDPVFSIEFTDGTISPLRLEVPANTRIKIELHNKGQSAAEFEMDRPKKEKVLAPGASSSVIFRNLDPGEYEFIDEFHPEAPKGVIVAK